MQLRQRLEILGGGKKSLAFGKSPSWEELIKIAKKKDKEAAIEYEIAQKKVAETARLARIEELKAMIPKKEEMWQEAAKYLENSYASAYDAATKIICELQEIAEYEDKRRAFDQKIGDFISDYLRRPAFIQRLRDNGVLSIKD